MKQFYEIHHQQYFNDTVEIDPCSFLSPLIAELKAKARILDIGCGSGRDMLWFKNKGYEPTGFEQSPSLAKLAHDYSGCPVIEGDFTAFNFSSLSFDALVLIGALVHITTLNFPNVFMSVCNALSSDGLILITMKEGKGISLNSDGRTFTLWQQDDLEAIFLNENFQILSFSRQISKLRYSDIWMTYILKKNEIV